MSAKRFQRLLRIREAQENEAAVVLGARLEEVSRAEQQRDRLIEYQGLYFQAVIPNDARMLKQIALVQQQLREALEQQELRISAAYSQVEQARSVWMERHQASLSLEKLIERRRGADAILEGRRQQRELDLWATRKAFEKERNDVF